MEAFIQKTKLITWLAKWRWWIISLIVLGLTVFEVWEDQSNPSTAFHLTEIIIYLIFLSISGVLIGALIQSIQSQHKYLQILNTKHKISLDLAAYDDWDALIIQVVKLPSRIAAVGMSCLYLQDPVTHEFSEIAHWEPDGKKALVHPGLEACQVCLTRQPGSGYVFSPCKMDETEEYSTSRFCLPVVLGTDLLALMCFQTAAGRALTGEQRSLFENIGDEISAALKAGQDRKVMREISDAKISLNERRKVSYYLHDNLAQNIAYLQLKLGQILSEKDHLSPDAFENDLESMQDIANDSFDTVRGILETLAPQTPAGFGATLHELVSKTGQRAHLEIEFQTIGEAVDLPLATSQAMLYAIQEILSNIEKHALATRVEIQVQWMKDDLIIRFSDNGVGFEPGQVDTARHFGLGILHERLDRVNARIEITSRKMAGTTVEIITPLRQPQIQG
jgi:signal transduction histidine kinase